MRTVRVRMSKGKGVSSKSFESSTGALEGIDGDEDVAYRCVTCGRVSGDPTRCRNCGPSYFEEIRYK